MTSGRTLVESTKPEFSAVRWPKRVKNPEEKLYTQQVQSSEGKYSLQIKIFEFYLSGSATPALWNFAPEVSKVSPHDSPVLWLKVRIGILGHRVAKTGSKSWRETLHTTNAKFIANPAFWNFAPVVRKVSFQDFLPVLAVLQPKIPIRYFQPGCDQTVLFTRVRPEAMLGTFDHGATIFLSQYFRPIVRPTGVLNAAVQAKRLKYPTSFSHLNKMEAETALLIASSAVVIAAYSVAIEKKKKRRSRRWWCTKLYCKRNCTDLMQDLKFQEVSGQYRNFTRMSSSCFEYLLRKISPRISRMDTKLREAISAQDRCVYLHKIPYLSSLLM